jgi:hypothetical protein
MLHKTVKATVETVADQGSFTALAAAYSVDRGNERIIPGAFQGSIEKWQASSKMIPLHWDHSGDPHDIIGTVDPAQTKETDAGLFVAGQLDLEGSEVAKEAWRSMKAGSLGLSFGYLVLDGAEAKDGVYELKAVDVFEISVTPAPMNADTRFLDLKSAKGAEVNFWANDIITALKALTERVEALEDVPPPTPVEDVSEQAAPAEAPQTSDPAYDQFDQARLDAVLPRRG